MAATFGRGAMTNGWVDIKNADVVLVMGGNPAENHPCGFKWVIEAKKTRKAKLCVVDPRFTRTAAVSDLYAPIRSGTDIAFLHGIMRYAIEKNRFHREYVVAHTNGPFLVSEKYGFQDGLFSGFDEGKHTYDKSSWAYEADPGTKSYQLDKTLENPRCVFQLLKKHVDRYTPEMVERVCGTPKEQFLRVAEMVTSTGNAERVGTILYALGWTEHSIGVQIIRAAAMMQLLLGNVGRAGGGVNALRGHSNIQGATDMGGNTEILPGYLKTPTAAMEDLKTYLEKATPTTLNKMAWGSMNYWSNYPKFMVSLLKNYFGDAATKENDYAYSWLPKVEGDYAHYSWLHLFDDMYRGKRIHPGGAEEPGPEGLISFGMNPVATGSNSKKMVAALSKLKWLLVVENSETETAQFWKAPKELDPLPAADIKTEVFLLPAATFAEKDGTFTNSARWMQWKWKALEPPGQAKSDQEVVARIFLAVRALYKKEGGVFPEPINGLTWAYSNPLNPDLDEVLKEINGKALKDVKDPKDETKIVRPAGQQLDNFGELREDGSTSCGNWLHLGVYTEKGNLAKRRNNADPLGMGMFHEWGFAWPANRRIMYNRAGADEHGNAWDATRPSIKWNGSKWVGDVPDMKPDAPPGTFGAFIMLPEGAGRLWSPVLAEGPFPEHYEAIEAACDNPLHPKVTSNPVVKKFTTDKDHYGTYKDYPIVCTSYRLTEHFHYWTKHQANGRLNVTQPGFFFEIPEALAKEKGIANGEMVQITSANGSIRGTALVTKRLKQMVIDGKPMWGIGMPIHWGFASAPSHQGPLVNTLTSTAMDPNTWTPEFKTFLVKLDRIGNA